MNSSPPRSFGSETPVICYTVLKHHSQSLPVAKCFKSEEQLDSFSSESSADIPETLPAYWHKNRHGAPLNIHPNHTSSEPAIHLLKTFNLRTGYNNDVHPTLDIEQRFGYFQITKTTHQTHMLNQL